MHNEVSQIASHKSILKEENRIVIKCSKSELISAKSHAYIQYPQNW
jgi:hypothetical protein